MNALHTTDIQFSQFGLHDHLLQSLNEQGLTHCTAIQAQCLPLAISGKDVAGQAQTGTGKTAAFLLVVMQRLLSLKQHSKDNRQHPRALIISPTRELTIQIHKDAEMLNKYANLSLALVYGGVDYEKQRDSLYNNIDILIGTPGRLIDYHKQKIFSLKNLEMLVLDEADRMFDLGFIADVRYLFRNMPKAEKRLSMLFSATLSHRINELAYEHMNSPEEVIINPEQITADNIQQSLYHVASNEKIPLLLGLLQSINPKCILIFVNTKRSAENILGYLQSNGFHAAILSGDVPQKKRQRLFNEFSQGMLPILVATDLAARGLHIANISHVFNYDLPQHAEDYVHRIGRTARAGAKGDAVSFACEEFVYSLTEIETYIGYRLPVKKVDADLLVKPKSPQRTARKHASHHKPKKHSYKKTIPCSN